MTRIFYNENEPYAAKWLEHLCEENLIAPGAVDVRSIVDLKPKDLEGISQAHFFAGIGGWSYALRLAGWPDDLPVWTGSCPCQPFSQAGRAKGFKDERHLWPTWFKLIRKCRPSIIFGEQVASPDGLKWLDLVFADLEREGYACGAADLCAAGVGAPHIRQRLYFVAVSGEQRREGERVYLRPRKPRQAVVEAARGGSTLELGDTGRSRSRGHAGTVSRAQTQGDSKRIDARHKPDVSFATVDPRLVGNAGSARSPKRSRPEDRYGAVRHEGAPSTSPSATHGAWANADWWLCRDGKARPAEPGSFPLADGVPTRVGRLRATGNAIVPEVAATFIRAVMSLKI